MNNLGILEKVHNAINESEYDAIVAVGPDNAQYLSGAALPYLYNRRTSPMLVFWPKGGDPSCVCPAEWASTVRESGWVKNVRSYTATARDADAAVEALVQLIHQSGKSQLKLGLDLNRVSHKLFEALREALPEAELAGCDEWLGQLRMVKTNPEMALLEQIADLTDHGINGAIHHVIVSSLKTALTLAEELRVHCMERGMDIIGYHAASQVASGEDAKKLWPLPPAFGFSSTRPLDAGAWVRMEIKTCLRGYWSDAARMMVTGDPTPEQSAAYQALVAVRETAMHYLRPGACCCDVFEAVKREAASTDIALLAEFGLGHGIGVTPCEPPYLNGSDETTLEPGMLLILDPVIRSPEGVLLRSKDTVRITDTGCEIVGWYKDWREPYIPIASI